MVNWDFTSYVWISKLFDFFYIWSCQPFQLSDSIIIEMTVFSTICSIIIEMDKKIKIEKNNFKNKWFN